MRTIIALALSAAAGAAQAQVPDTVFRDCADCPEMVVVPAGTFEMGTPDEAGWPLNEHARPRHEVRIARDFALARSEITWTEYEACSGAGACPELPRLVDSPWYGTTRDDHPLILGGPEAIAAYLAWLSRVSGHDYRLPSEAEWEYAAGAGTWPALGGEAEGFDCTDNFPEGAERESLPGTWDCFVEPVGRTEANALGLHGMLGNVAEWTADCWHEDFTGAPEDGSAWTDGEACAPGVIKGGTAAFGPAPTRSDWRWYTEVYHPEGFRVARDLP